MKISPINFVSILEPELISFWEGRVNVDEKTIETQRTHNFKLMETMLSVHTKHKKTEATDPLCEVKLVEIPQQEDNAAINTHIYAPGLENAIPLLMVFKKEEDTEMWVKKIIDGVKTANTLGNKRLDAIEREKSEAEEAARAKSEGEAQAEA